jgi:hypothetical protein
VGVKKKRSVKDVKYPEVEEFLGSISMQKYLSMFIENGFEELETILELRDEDFNVMKVPLGHKLRILKRIKELKPVEVKPVKPVQKLKGIQKNTLIKTDQPEEAKQVKKSVRFGETSIINEKEEPIVIDIAKLNQQEEVKVTTKSKKSKKVNARIRTMYKMDTEQSLVSVKSDEIKEACWNCYKLFTKGQGFIDPANHNVTAFCFILGIL